MTNPEQAHIQLQIKIAHGHYRNCNYKPAIWILEKYEDCDLIAEESQNYIKRILGYCYLNIGELQKGWSYWGCRPQATRFIPVMNQICGLPLWKGEQLKEGPLLLMAEDGIGDELYYSAVFHLLPWYADNIIIQCDSRLKSIYERTYPDFIFIERDDWSAVRKHAKECTAWGLVGDLPRYLDPQLESNRNKKLVIDPEKIEQIREKLQTFGKDKQFIGVSYKTSGLKGDFPNYHEVFMGHLSELDEKGTVFINLQENNLTKKNKRAFLYDQLRINQIDDIDLWNDFESIGALIANMDYIVTISNYLGHLSGRLLKATDVLLPKFANVKWCFGNPEKYSWYPHSNIFQSK